MASATLNKLQDLINPQVLADMINEKFEKRIAFTPYVRLDNTLSGRAGDTITVPRFKYSFPDAAEVAEGEDIPLKKLAVDTEQYKIKKVGIGWEISDEALLSGYGDPMARGAYEMAQSSANKVDADVLAQILSASNTYTASKALSYATIVNAVDGFMEEVNTPKVMFVNPAQVTQLRLDPDFIDKTKYGATDVMVTGEIGRIANTIIVPSLKIVESEGFYTNPIIKLSVDPETEEDTPALTLYTKRELNVETERVSRNRTTQVTGDKIYTVALTNEGRVINCKTPATAVAAG